MAGTGQRPGQEQTPLRTKSQQLGGAQGGSLSSRVFEQLESDILSNRISPGESLNEQKLSLQLGVSRTPVREAIRMLEQTGLVEVTPHKGALVRGISRKDLEDIYTIRMYVEGLSARWAAEHADAKQLQELTELVELQEFYLQRDRMGQINELDSHFHECIYQASGSRTLRHILSELHHMIQWFRAQSFRTQGRAEKMVEEHRKIVEAIAARDGKRAEELMVIHIEKARDNILKLMAERDARQEER